MPFHNIKTACLKPLHYMSDDYRFGKMSVFDVLGVGKCTGILMGILSISHHQLHPIQVKLMRRSLASPNQNLSKTIIIDPSHLLTNEVQPLQD